MNKLRDTTILLVDDEPLMLRALSKVLAGEGADVTATESARAAMDVLAARGKKFDLVITDLQMPFMTGVMTGVTVVYAIHELYPSLPVIVLTAYGTPNVKAQCLLHGARAFLEKPLDTRQLLAAIGDVCPNGVQAR